MSVRRTDAGSDGAAWRRQSLADPSEDVFLDGEAISLDASDAELSEFLAADLAPVPADPQFKDDLRELLWKMVQDGDANRSGRH